MSKWSDSPIMNRLQSYLCGWMSLWYFVFPLAFFLNPSKGGTSNVFYLGILLPWLILLLMGKVKIWYKSSFYFVTLLLFFYLWLNSLWSDKNSYSDVIYLFKWLVYPLCLLTAPVLIVERYPNLFEKLLLFIFCAAVASAALTIGHHINTYGETFSHTRMVGWGHGYNSIALGLHHGIAVLIGLFLVDRYREKAVWFALSSLIPLSAMMLSHSRGPMVALVICSVVVLFLFKRSKVIVLTKIALFSFIAGATVYIGWEQLLARGFSGRPEIWEQVWQLVKKSMIWGEGYSLQASTLSYHGEILNHSHNVILELLRYGGIVAVLLFLCQLATLVKLLKGVDDLGRYYAIILAFNVIVMLISGWYLLDRPNYFWLGYWYPLGMLMVKQHMSNKDKPAQL